MVCSYSNLALLLLLFFPPQIGNLMADGIKTGYSRLACRQIKFHFHFPGILIFTVLANSLYLSLCWLIHFHFSGNHFHFHFTCNCLDQSLSRWCRVVRRVEEGDGREKVNWQQNFNILIKTHPDKEGYSWARGVHAHGRDCRPHHGFNNHDDDDLFGKDFLIFIICPQTSSYFRLPLYSYFRSDTSILTSGYSYIHGSLHIWRRSPFPCLGGWLDHLVDDDNYDLYHDDEDRKLMTTRLMVLMMMMMMMMMIMMMTITMTKMLGWDLASSCYFTFVTLTTIGFGNNSSLFFVMMPWW